MVQKSKKQSLFFWFGGWEGSCYNLESMREKESSLVASAFVLGVCLAIGLVVGGYFLAAAVMEAKRGDRTVTVRGLAEKEVAADQVVWPIIFRVVAKDLEELQGMVTKNRKTVVDFLLGQGFPAAEITTRPPNTVDFEARGPSDSGKERPYRYLAIVTVMLQSKDVPRTIEAMEKAGDLVRQGIVLGGEEYGEAKPEFLFTKLNEIKPGLLQEANENARRSAERFGDDAGNGIGAIRRANQGLIEVRDRDEQTPYQKVIRVVTTVEYYLKK